MYSLPMDTLTECATTFKNNVTFIDVDLVKKVGDFYPVGYKGRDDYFYTHFKFLLSFFCFLSRLNSDIY